jgi:hypothetical protein
MGGPTMIDHTPPTAAELKQEEWLDRIYREAGANIAWLIGCSVHTAKELYGHLVEAEADALQRAAADEDYRYAWDQLEKIRRQRRGGITQ